MKLIIQTLSALFVILTFSFWTPQKTFAQGSGSPCTFKIWTIDKNGLEKLSPFTDDNLKKIEYDISFDITTLLPNKQYVVFTDNGIFGYDYREEKSVVDVVGNTGHLKGVLDKDLIPKAHGIYTPFAFNLGTHQLKIKYSNGSIDLCTDSYTIEKGLTQEPIRCSLTPLSNYPGNPSYMSTIHDFIVNVDIHPDSNVYAGVGLTHWGKELWYVNLLTNERNRIALAQAFHHVNDYKYVVPVPAGTIPLPGKYRLLASFWVAYEFKGECASEPFTMCASGSSDPICLYPTTTPTPSPLPPTPTESPQCKGCTVKMCEGGGRCDLLNCIVCRPTATPIQPFPSLKPLCDQIGLGYDGSDCRKCIDPPKAGIWTAVGCVPTNPAEFIKEYVFTTGVGIAGGVAFLYFIYGSFLVLTSAGNAERVEEAKAIITSSITGLLFIIFSVVLLRIIGVDILRIPGFS